MYPATTQQIEPVSRKATYPSEANIKPCKKPIKKSQMENSFYADNSEQMPDMLYRRRINSSDEHKTNNKTATPTKFKSTSWKRSDKSTAPINTLSNKKHKKSSNWLRFSNSKIKKSDTEQPYNSNESLSACRPGTTYSDVLFSAGCSNLVKIKTCITPRFYSSQSTNAGAKKPNKSLFKFSGKLDNKISQNSKVEEKKTLFPALQSIKNKFIPFSVRISNNTNHNAEKTQMPSSTVSNSSQKKTDETAVLMLPDMEGLTLDNHKIEDHVADDIEAPAKTSVNDSKYLLNSITKIPKQNLISVESGTSKGFPTFLLPDMEDLTSEQHVNDDVQTPAEASANDSKYLLNSITKIPKWNFVSIDTGTSNGFPKFLYQFEDENYLKAEKMALLGLKLAIGDCNPNNK